MRFQEAETVAAGAALHDRTRTHDSRTGDNHCVPRTGRQGPRSTRSSSRRKQPPAHLRWDGGPSMNPSVKRHAGQSACSPPLEEQTEKCKLLLRHPKQGFEVRRIMNNHLPCMPNARPCLRPGANCSIGLQRGHHARRSSRLPSTTTPSRWELPLSKVQKFGYPPISP